MIRQLTAIAVFALVSAVANAQIVLETPQTNLVPVPPAPAQVAQTSSLATAKDSVLYVNAGNSYGSGTYIGNLLFVSAWHVVEGDPNNITIGFDQIPAKVVGADRTWDVAILKLAREPGCAPCPLTTDLTIDSGEVFYGCGYGQSMHDADGMRTIGRRLWRGRCDKYLGKYINEVLYMEWFHFVSDTGPGAIPGDSGGGVFREDGTFVTPLWGTTGDGTSAARCRIFRRLLQRVSPGFGCPGGQCPPGGQGQSCPPGGGCQPLTPPDGGLQLAPPDNYPEVPSGPAPPIKGQRGEKGENGEKGETGDTGPAGPQGPKGDNGDAAVITQDHLNQIADLLYRRMESEGKMVTREEVMQLVSDEIGKRPDSFNFVLKNDRGEVVDQQEIKLGGTLPLLLREVPKPVQPAVGGTMSSLFGL